MDRRGRLLTREVFGSRCSPGGDCCLRCFVIEQEAITIPAAKAIPRAEATPAAMTGIVTRPDQPFLIPGAVGGALHQSRRTAAAGCWPAYVRSTC